MLYINEVYTSFRYIMPALKFKGFSLVEIMVAVSIVAVITAVGAMSFSKSQSLARDAKRKQDLRSIATALELYYQKNKHYPCTNGWQSSTSGSSWIVDTASVAAGCGVSNTNQNLDPAFIDRTPVDPTNNSATPWSTSSDNYSYAYFSGPFIGSCTYGTWFWLMTRLENGNDPESYGKQRYTPCGYPTYPEPTWSGNVFMISSQ